MDSRSCHHICFKTLFPSCVFLICHVFLMNSYASNELICFSLFIIDYIISLYLYLYQISFSCIVHFSHVPYISNKLICSYWIDIFIIIIPLYIRCIFFIPCIIFLYHAFFYVACVSNKLIHFKWINTFIIVYYQFFT